MPLVARRGIRSPYALLQARPQPIDVDYPAIPPLPFILGRDINTNPTQGAHMTEPKMSPDFKHGQPLFILL